MSTSQHSEGRDRSISMGSRPVWTHINFQIIQVLSSETPQKTKSNTYTRLFKNFFPQERKNNGKTHINSISSTAGKMEIKASGEEKWT